MSNDAKMFKTLLQTPNNFITLLRLHKFLWQSLLIENGYACKDDYFIKVSVAVVNQLRGIKAVRNL